MTDLPPCEFRGDPITITAPGSGAVRETHECYQMHLRGREEVTMTSEKTEAVCIGGGLHGERRAADGSAFWHPVAIGRSFVREVYWLKHWRAGEGCPVIPFWILSTMPEDEAGNEIRKLLKQ